MSTLLGTRKERKGRVCVAVEDRVLLLLFRNHTRQLSTALSILHVYCHTICIGTFDQHQRPLEDERHRHEDDSTPKYLPPGPVQKREDLLREESLEERLRVGVVLLGGALRQMDRILGSILGDLVAQYLPHVEGGQGGKLEQ